MDKTWDKFHKALLLLPDKFHKKYGQHSGLAFLV